MSDLVDHGEAGFSDRTPTGKAGAEASALIAELRTIGYLPVLTVNTATAGDCGGPGIARHPGGGT